MQGYIHTILVALAVVLSPVANAKGLPQMRKLREAFKHANVRPVVQSIAPQCADFTGKWVGTCVYTDGDVDESDVTIEQDHCTSITVGGFFVDINGGMAVQLTEAPDVDSFNVAASIGYKWNDSQTRLHSLMNYSINYQYAGSVRSTMWLAGEQLRVKQDKSTGILSIDGASDMTEYLEDCTYNRVGN